MEGGGIIFLSTSRAVLEVYLYVCTYASSYQIFDEISSRRSYKDKDVYHCVLKDG